MAAAPRPNRWRVGAPLLIAQAVIATVTLRDIAARPDAAIRGPRRLWQVVATANSGGALAYWVIGRRRS